EDVVDGPTEPLVLGRPQPFGNGHDGVELTGLETGQHRGRCSAADPLHVLIQRSTIWPLVLLEDVTSVDVGARADGRGGDHPLPAPGSLDRAQLLHARKTTVEEILASDDVRV